MGMHGISSNRGLIGAVPTALNRYLEYVDGSIMTDGYFSDASHTWIGDLVYGTKNPDCFVINEEGNVVQCDKKCKNVNQNGMECDQVICEKALAPKDKALCLDKSATVPSKITLSDSFDIEIPVRTTLMEAL